MAQRDSSDYRIRADGRVERPGLRDTCARPARDGEIPIVDVGALPDGTSRKATVAAPLPTP